ncbi:hypothetical protein PLICRDRAFT_600917 [Plicaturopsis crispa FD-325 SS-3]|nr:hypothetical protein PLICRDRAFT_600917 [Plicaturopsis crispa FD-325 SS-3]
MDSVLNRLRSPFHSSLEERKASIERRMNEYEAKIRKYQERLDRLADEAEALVRETRAAREGPWSIPTANATPSASPDASTIYTPHTPIYTPVIRLANGSSLRGLQRAGAFYLQPDKPAINSDSLAGYAGTDFPVNERAESSIDASAPFVSFYSLAGKVVRRARIPATLPPETPHSLTRWVSIRDDRGVLQRYQEVLIKKEEEDEPTRPVEVCDEDGQATRGQWASVPKRDREGEDDRSVLADAAGSCSCSSAPGSQASSSSGSPKRRKLSLAEDSDGRQEGNGEL